MKLNQNTLEVLKNFAGINTNILIKQGKELSTISTMRNIFAKAEITDEFTKEFGIYDLNEFLGTLSALDTPDVSLTDKKMVIKEKDGSSTGYWFSDPSVIVSPTKAVNMPEADVTFTLSQVKYQKLLKMAAILKAPDLALIGTKGGNVVLKICDKKNDTSNTYEVIVGQSATADYTFYFKVENMKMLDGDYDVSVSAKSISHCKNKKLPVEYWIALEPDSTITK